MRRSAAIKATASLLAASMVVGAAAPIAPSAVARHHRSLCNPHGSETLAANRSVRVYSLPEWIEGVRTGRHRTYVCLFRRGKTLALEPSHRPRFHTLAHFTLAGTVLAFVENQHGIDTGCVGINVIDVAKGRTIFSVPVGCYSANFGGSGVVAVNLIVNEHGSVAWIVSRRETNEPMTFEVHIGSTSGSALLLDAGPSIVPESLRLAPGGEVSWLDTGRTLYVPLA
jgi:hypothetical protein